MSDFNNIPKSLRREELGKVFKVAVPLSLYYITEVAMGITDMVIVGRLGSVELAAVGLTANFMVEAIIVCFGLLSVVGVLSSNSLGADDHAGVSNTVGQGFWVGLFLSVVVLILAQWLPDLFVMTGQDPEVVHFSRQYLAWFMWVVPLAMIFVVLRNFLTVLSMTNIVAYITLPAVLLNLVLNYALVFGSWGFPEMGVAGAGAASVIVNFCMVLTLVAYVGYKSECRRFALHHGVRRLDFRIWASIFKLGTPVGMTAFLEGGLFAVVGIMMGTLGADWLAANEILFHMIPIAFVIALAIGESAAVRIAFYTGARNTIMPGWIARVALLVGCGVMLLSALVLWFFPDVIAGFFIDTSNPENHQVLAIVLSLASIAAIFQLFDGAQVITAWCLRGFKDTLVPMWIASAGYWICGLGVGYWLGFQQGLGAAGVWWGLAAGLMMTAILLLIRLKIRLGRPAF